jgi:ribosomal RNA-processing protein 17
MLAERAAENAAQVEAAYGGNPADEGGAQGSDSEDVIQEEYENEEQVATVTVVEEFDIDALIHTESPLERPDPGSSSNQQARRVELPAKRSKFTATNKKSGASAKKFKYGTNAARLAEKKKQQARKFEKAARAGGKQSRSSKWK